MVKYICPKCNKDLKKKSHYVQHTENKKNPCDKSDLLIPPNSTNCPPNSTNHPQTSVNLLDNLIKDPKPYINNCTCMYCDKTFARTDSLQRHLNGRCKSKINYDEFEKLKEDMKMITKNYEKIENENENLKKEIDEIKITQTEVNKNTDSSIVNNNSNNNQINKGVILNTTNIQIVQFGEEDIDKINLNDAMKMYLKSTGGNIASNMLAYLNMNKEHPENNNICITDNSREIVKIHNGKKFIYKKFKNVKNDILDKVLKNTRKIVTRFEDDENIKKSQDTKTKLKINDVSLKLIDGVDGEDIVREEIKEKERELKLKLKNNINDDEKNSVLDDETDTDEERDLTFEERLRVDHLNKKKEGLQIKTFENIKEELYNGRELIAK
jgi:hypothetical protein